MYTMVHKRRKSLLTMTKCANKMHKSPNLTQQNDRRWMALLRVGLYVSIVLILMGPGVMYGRPLLQEKVGMTELDIFNELLARFNTSYTLRNNNSTNNNPAILRPGYVLSQQGARAKFPVVMIPGFITSGLELWAGEDCAKKNFRRRLWGSLRVFAESFFTDNECWRKHISLDPFTGSDPPNIKLRPAQGFEAADFFMSTFWVWDKLIENLADVGYDGSTMTMMSYDWRLSFPVLEQRDGYFTKLRYHIEAQRKHTGKKVVLTSHSMGSQVVLFFFKWVVTDEKRGGGGGGKNWVDENIHAFINIAGPLLGVPKAVPALLSGEMKDTAILLGTVGSMVEHFFGRKSRKDMWNTWGSLWHMLPKGGDAIWGKSSDVLKSNSDSIDYPDSFISHDIEEPFIFLNSETVALDDGKNSLLNYTSWSVHDAVSFLHEWGGGLGSTLHSARLHSEANSQSNWEDPSLTPLPIAPKMKIYCLYGVGIETERSYFYKRSNPASSELKDALNDDLPFVLDTSINEPSLRTQYGTRFSDGDISVPVLSLGYMCLDGWKNNKILNPSNIDTITREYKHKEEFQVNDPMRGGPESANHVDILGNIDVTTDILKIVTDFSTNEVTSRIVSEIENISARINLHTNGGLEMKKKSISSLITCLKKI